MPAPTLSGKRAPAVVALAVLLGLCIVYVPWAIALLTPAMLGVLVLLALVRGLIRWPDEEARRRIRTWTMIAFASHLLFGLFGTLTSSTIRFYLAADSFTYDAGAHAIVQHWTAGLPFPFVPTGKEGFFYLLAGLYWIFGSHVVSGLAVNAALSAAVVPVLSDVTDRLFGSAAARYVAPLVVCLPGLFLWTSQLMREAGMLLLLAVALSATVRLVERISISALVVLVSSLLLAFTFRAWVALVVAAALLLGLALGHRNLLNGLGTGLGTLFIAATLMLVSGLGYAGYRAAVGLDLEKANVVRKDLALSGETGYEADVDISTTQNAVGYLPRGVVSVTLGPFPWSLRSTRQLPFVPDMLAWWLLLPSLYRGFRRAGHLIGRRRLLMVLPSVAVVLLMSLSLGNFGTVVRERLQLQVLVIPLIALGLAERRARTEDPDGATDDVERPELALRA